MTLSERLLAVLRWFASTRACGRDMQKMAAEREDGTYDGPIASRALSFESEYYAATDLLKQRMNRRYPDNYHARLNSEAGVPYDYGAKRADAIDAASTAIAMALRDGASVREAAEAGAASVGI